MVICGDVPAQAESEPGGWAVMEEVVTLSVAAVDVAEPQAPVRTQRKRVPPVALEEVVMVAVVVLAPEAGAHDAPLSVLCCQRYESPTPEPVMEKVVVDPAHCEEFTGSVVVVVGLTSSAMPATWTTPSAQMVYGPPAFAVGGGTTVTATEAQPVFPQKPSQRAKYVVLTSGAAMTSGLPEPTEVPRPHPPAYQPSVLPMPPEAERVMVGCVPPQKVGVFTEAIVGGEMSVMTVKVRWQVEVLLAASVTEMVTVVGPRPTRVPAAGSCVMTSEPEGVQLSVAETSGA